jgi:hypothetical protein
MGSHQNRQRKGSLFSLIPIDLAQVEKKIWIGMGIAQKIRTALRCSVLNYSRIYLQWYLTKVVTPLTAAEVS